MRIRLPVFVDRSRVGSRRRGVCWRRRARPFVLEPKLRRHDRWGLNVQVDADRFSGRAANELCVANADQTLRLELEQQLLITRSLRSSKIPERRTLERLDGNRLRIECVSRLCRQPHGGFALRPTGTPMFDERGLIRRFSDHFEKVAAASARERDSRSNACLCVDDFFRLTGTSFVRLHRPSAAFVARCRNAIDRTRSRSLIYLMRVNVKPPTGSLVNQSDLESE